MRIPPRGPRRRIPRWQRGNWKAEKRGKLICRASRGSRGVETGGKEEGRRRRRWRGGRERARIASIDYEARRASLMADSDIYRVNGRRPSIFPRDDLSYYAINTRLSSPRALFSLSLLLSLSPDYSCLDIFGGADGLRFFERIQRGDFYRYPSIIPR